MVTLELHNSSDFDPQYLTNLASSGKMKEAKKK